MNNAAILIELLLGLLDRADSISKLLQTAHKENRDVSDAELDALASVDDISRIKLQDAIDKAKGK
jgi:hypothetical protein